MATRSKALVWAGVGLCVAGAAGLIVGGVLNVDAADPWASVAGGAAGLLGLAVTLYALLGSAPTPSSSVKASGARSVAAGGSIGTVSTGNGATGGAAPTMPTSPSRPSGPVNSSGERSVAAGGDIGSVSTGDDA
ncbi:hypothetical protein [Streptomyces lanatus]|uniref:Integral membrane protein n=1 Tax=Streptomyces lanatus TaxID=66900 RepID=A0ABV1Y1B5_9ACTN|nr:hypothetical protein [Streptomyces lanatus]